MWTESENWLLLVNTQIYKLQQLVNVEIIKNVNLKERNVRIKWKNTDMADGNNVFSNAASYITSRSI